MVPAANRKAGKMKASVKSEIVVLCAIGGGEWNVISTHGSDMEGALESVAFMKDMDEIRDANGRKQRRKMDPVEACVYKIARRTTVVAYEEVL